MEKRIFIEHQEKRVQHNQLFFFNSITSKQYHKIVMVQYKLLIQQNMKTLEESTHTKKGLKLKGMCFVSMTKLS